LSKEQKYFWFPEKR